MLRLPMIIALALAASLASASCSGDACAAKPDEQSLLQVQSQVKSSGDRVEAKSQSAKTKGICENDDPNEGMCRFKDSLGQVEASWEFGFDSLPVDSLSGSIGSIMEWQKWDVFATGKELYDKYAKKGDKKNEALTSRSAFHRYNMLSITKVDANHAHSCADLVASAVGAIEEELDRAFSVIALSFPDTQQSQTCSCYTEAAKKLTYQTFYPKREYPRWRLPIYSSMYKECVDKDTSWMMGDPESNYGLKCEGAQDSGRAEWYFFDRLVWPCVEEPIQEERKEERKEPIQEERKEENNNQRKIGTGYYGKQFIRYCKDKLK